MPVKGRGDQSSFHSCKRILEAASTLERLKQHWRRLFQFSRKVALANQIRVTHDYHPFHEIYQFPNVARVIVAEKAVQDFRLHALPEPHS